MYIHVSRYVLMRKTMRPNAEDDASYCGRRYVLSQRRLRPVGRFIAGNGVSYYHRKKFFLKIDYTLQHPPLLFHINRKEK